MEAICDRIVGTPLAIEQLVVTMARVRQGGSNNDVCWTPGAAAHLYLPEINFENLERLMQLCCIDRLDAFSIRRMWLQNNISGTLCLLQSRSSKSLLQDDGG